jgi:hypothetical protein
VDGDELGSGDLLRFRELSRRRAVVADGRMLLRSRSFSNGADFVRFVSGRPAAVPPLRKNANSGRSVEGFQSDEALVRNVETGRAAVVFLKSGLVSQNFASLAECESMLSRVHKVDLGDGVVFWHED